MGERRLTNLVRFRVGSFVASSHILFTSDTGSTGATVLKNTTGSWSVDDVEGTAVMAATHRIGLPIAQA